MCGICGIVPSDPRQSPGERELLSMCERLVHRGPDDAGMFVAPGIALGSRRLAILDLAPRGRMPMVSPDGRFHIVYNGEVYNFRELRRDLESEGHVFRTQTDTEVLLHLYEEEGAAMLSRMNGMFAIAIWDQQQRQLFLARDRMGVKPLYYAEYRGTFYFASEEKALFAAGVPASFDHDVAGELLCFRYAAGERTPFAGVKRLLPGHYLERKRTHTKIRRWWSLAAQARERRERPHSEPQTWFRETFDSAIALRRISDVPLGVLLSGGLDSGSVAATLASQAGDGVHSFTVRFLDHGYDEGPLAREIAEKWRLTRHELNVTPEELHDRLATASWLNDEPLAHGNDAHLWAIAECAKQYVTVLLSGEGADETLGGYVRYRPLRHPALLGPARAVLPWVTARWNVSGRARKLSRFLSLKSLRDLVLFNACDVLPADLALLGMTAADRYPYREHILDEAIALYPAEPVRQAMYSDQHTFLCSLLDRNDRMTMGASIECRVPFLDYRLVEGAAALPSSTLFAEFEGKQLLKRAIGHRLTDSVLRHKKWGFGVPWGHYLRHVPAFRELVTRLPDAELVRQGFGRRSGVQTLVSRYLAGDDGCEALLKQVMAIAVWYDGCCRPMPYTRATELGSVVLH